MSQNGSIFNIAPESRNGSATPSAGPSANGQAAASPFSAVAETPRAGDSTSPFAGVAASEAGESRGIPARRPVGQPPALGSSQEAEQPAQEQAVFTPVAEAQPVHPAAGFEMNGFPTSANEPVMEAAPVAQAPAASPFTPVEEPVADFTSVQNALEPQQDFAASPFAPVEPAPQPQAAPSRGEDTPFAQPLSQPTQSMPQPAQPVAQPTQPVAQAAPVATTASQPNPAMQQLELRAIFGVDHLLNQSDILQRARTLPGVRNVALVGNNEVHALSNFRQALQSMGLGDSGDLKLSSSGGDVDFITETDTTLAVLHEGSYAPGVRETLIIAAREIEKLA